VVFGLAPAFESSGIDLNRALKEASGQASKSGRGARMRRIFVAGEIALAVVVLISTTLLVKSFVISVRSSPGFNAANLLVAQVALPKTKYAQEARQRNFSDDVLARIRALPGVVSAGVSSAVPFGGFGQTVVVEAVGKPAPQPGETLGARFSAVSPNYFTAMQMHLVKGRAFTELPRQRLGAHGRHDCRRCERREDVQPPRTAGTADVRAARAISVADAGICGANGQRFRGTRDSDPRLHLGRGCKPAGFFRGTA
jgi:putative ABC transport system permease protein